MSYIPLHNYGSPALARMIRDAARQEFGFRHPKTAAAQGHLDALLGRSIPQTGVGRVAYARQKGQAGYKNKGERKAHDRALARLRPEDHGAYPSAIAAAQGRKTASECSGRVLDIGIPTPASIAYQRAAGNEGYCNRASRRHGHVVTALGGVRIVDRRAA